MAKRRPRRLVGRHDPGRGRRRAVVFVAALALGVVAVFAILHLGPRRPREAVEDGPHDHPLGPHGGAVVAIDRDNRFHAEAVFEPDGWVRLYTLGRALTDVRPVVARTVCAAVRGHGGEHEFAVMLRPEPQQADPPGTASRFRGRLPPALWRGHLSLVVWSLPVDGARFRFEIALSDALPAEAVVAQAEAEEAALFATPKGKYAPEDIRANGEAPASRKFRGQRPAHDDRPAPGERVCPVTRAKADARFVWVVGRQEYRFCCPPCIDDFVRAAKDRPDEVQEPEAYRHR
ncbi:MAG: hypothetical protein K2V38_01075 [Gemmataceae bacterium]|nr:hypothetical protein [Gemmataceae bacterium]